MSHPEPLGSFRVFEDYRHSVNSTVVLFTTALALAADAQTVVEVGCGRGAPVDPAGRGRRLHDLRGLGRTVIGIDIDPVGAENPVIDEFRMIDGDRWPLEDASVDLVYSDWTIEHVRAPERFVAELSRVLRPGGAFVARSVSRRSLLSLAARIVPNRQHAKVLARMQSGRAEQDVFPTVYGMNTVPALSALLDPDFDWSVSFHPGLEQYALRWPRLARVVAAVEPHLPRRMQMVLIVNARKR
jgi:SAM-dependent methyltransferase